MTKRIQYIDALRGFIMFLVIFGHIFIYSLKYEEYEPIVYSFFFTFYLPLFFFISGYLGFKASNTLSFSSYASNITKKALLLLVPSIVFLFCYRLINGHGFLACLVSDGFNIYWFTEVLFEFFVVYYSLALLCYKTSQKLFSPIIILIAAISVIILSFCYHSNLLTNILKLRAFCRYFQFFVFGLLCKKYNEKILSIITSQKTKTILIILFFGLFLLLWSQYIGMNSIAYKTIHDLIIRYTGLLLVFSIFASHSSFFEQEGKISRSMQFVGRRTLDIFLIHYFFLPNIEFLKPYFINNQNIILEFTLALILATLVLGICLAFSFVIRQSEFLGHYLFGMKSERFKF